MSVLQGIDSHQHFWAYNEVDYTWMGAGPEWSVLKRSFLPADLAPLLSSASLRGCVAVQARQSLQETAWLLELADAHSFIKGVVGWVDLRAAPSELTAQLESFAAHRAFVGVRHVIHDEPDACAFMSDPAFRAGIAQLAGKNLTYDLLLFPEHLSAATELVAAFPGQTFVLDHMGNPDVKAGSAAAMGPYLTDLKALAAFKNVTVKLSGMVTKADWQGQGGKMDDSLFKPFIDAVLESFGPDREL